MPNLKASISACCFLTQEENLGSVIAARVVGKYMVSCVLIEFWLIKPLGALGLPIVDNSLQSSDKQEILCRKGFNGTRPSIWALQGLPFMTLACFMDILLTVNNLAAEGCYFIGELPAWLTETEVVSKPDTLKWIDKLFMSNGFRVDVITYDEAAKHVSRNPPSGDYGNILFVAKQLRLSDSQIPSETLRKVVLSIGLTNHASASQRSRLISPNHCSHFHEKLHHRRPRRNRSTSHSMSSLVYSMGITSHSDSGNTDATFKPKLFATSGVYLQRRLGFNELFSPQHSSSPSALQNLSKHPSSCAQAIRRIFPRSRTLKPENPTASVN
ncbi:hypothetical protein IFM89_037116 [Coptis chinensis]|uniref:Uncharacterized protein n=1 Tax=Coptis chinensis TaxID=261450 RepID=A0A835HSH5_9MAGN|nr:hypothetical protein IFM89_037116 [Coptis chinensis]